MIRAVFLDRDGVLNYDSPDYVFDVNQYRLYPEVSEVLTLLKSKGFKLIVITNQAGISRGIYTRQQMERCHAKLTAETDHLIDDIFYSPYHPTVTLSLSRKPGTLLFERAMALHGIDPSASWMVGDKQSDLDPAKSLGMKTIGIERGRKLMADELVKDLGRAAEIITGNTAL